MKLSEEAYRQLYGQILPFWKGLRDHQRGGFVSLVDFDLRRCAEAERGCILNSRILWFFSEAYRTLGDADLLDDAHHAYAMLRKMEDKEYGGVYWSVWPDGTVADSTKHTYNQAFAIYALSSFYRASGCSEALSKAMELMGIIESRMCDEDGYLEAFHRDFSRTGNEKLSENGVNATRTMNTLLHLLEAYTNLYEVSEDTVVRGKILHILDVWEKYIFDPEQRRQNVFFDEKYRSLLDLHSYGHDIEASWLCDHTLDVLKNEPLTNRLRPMLMSLPEEVYRKAYTHRGVCNECECSRIDTTRVWWVQAEALLGFLNAWRRTGEERYLDASRSLWRFIGETISDPRPGSEWFWSTDEEGKPVQRPIVSNWKCPYHNGRMLLEIIRRYGDVQL